MTDQVDSRFADPAATKELYLGACGCPGSPHVAGDIAVVRTEVGDAELKSAYGAGRMQHADGTGYYDEAYADTVAIARFTRSWNLVRLNGRGKPEPRPLDMTQVALLDEGTFAALRDHCELLAAGPDREHPDKRVGRLPNASGGSSESSSPVTASSTPKTRKPRSSTTRSSSPGKVSGPTG